MHYHHILLLKNPDSENSTHQDPYSAALASHNITSSIIPTLSHSYTDPDRLADIVVRGGGAEYGGVIITSGRAVDAWGNALGVLNRRGMGEGKCNIYSLRCDVNLLS
jgi:uroporphyrinogen-III synthase